MKNKKELVTTFCCEYYPVFKQVKNVRLDALIFKLRLVCAIKKQYNGKSYKDYLSDFEDLRW